jgi:RNA-binding protein YlmH
VNLYQHFRKEEHAFIDKVLEWVNSVEIQYSPKLTDFLDPREQEIVKLIIGNESEVKVDFDGGSETSERKRAFIYPTYYEPNQSDYKLNLFEIVYPAKFVSIDHRQILGSLMSIGLKRSKFGDILVENHKVQIVVAQEIGDYLKMNLLMIGKASISMKELPITDIIHTEEEWTEQSTSVSSLRLDVVMASIYNLARQKTQAIIQNGQVKVNWKVIENPSFECTERDIISVRGFGRSKLSLIEGKSKKDKWRIMVGRQK